MLPHKTIYSKDHLLIVVIFIMLAGLFISRALLSITSVLLIVFFFSKRRNAFEWKRILLAAMLMILPVIFSGIWSSDKNDWLKAVTIRVPFLTIGLALSTQIIKPCNWQRVVQWLMLLTLLGTFWSIGQYVFNSQAILQNYLKAKVMPTPLDNDHIRFSWLVVLVMILSLMMYKSTAKKAARIVIICYLAWLTLYLHLLAAKTGLLCFYAASILLVIQYIFQNRKWLSGAALLLLIFCLPVTAWYVMPSLQNRMQYVLYDYSNYSKGIYLPGSSDGARVLSLKAGWDITSKHLLTGIGFGDIKPAVNNWHEVHNPSTPVIERFLPLNEWLIYGSGSGLPGMILFSAGLIVLLWPLLKKNMFGLPAVAVLLLPVVTDDTLESQFGVVIFIFVSLWFMLYEPENCAVNE